MSQFDNLTQGRKAPLLALVSINILYPLLVAYLLAQLKAFPSSYLTWSMAVYWMSVIVIFTANESAARRWRPFRWAFWTVSALNLFAILMGGVAFITVAHYIPAVVMLTITHIFSI